MLVEKGSHSIDQPEGRTLGQVRLVFGSSKVIPENKIYQKPEYTNTQQDWSDTVALYLEMLVQKGSGFTFAEKPQRVGP